MANGTFYVDAVNGSDSNDGLSEANAKQTLTAGVGLFSGGGNTLHVQATGAYTLTATVSVATSGDTTDGPNVIEGYTTTPGARDGRPTITSATSSVDLFTIPGTDYLVFRHLNLTHTGGARGAGLNNTSGTSTGIRVDDCTTDGLSSLLASAWQIDNCAVVNCDVANCTSLAIQYINSVVLLLEDCIFRGGASHAVRLFGPPTALIRRCEFRNNAGHGVHLNSSGGYAPIILISACTFRGQSAGSGFRSDETGSAFTFMLSDNVFYNNSTYGVDLACTAAIARARVLANRNNAYGSNTSGARNNLAVGHGDVTLTADPFFSSSDSTPNDTAGGGLLLRGAGSNGTDIGAVQTEMPSNADIADAVWTYGERTLTG